MPYDRNTANENIRASRLVIGTLTRNNLAFCDTLTP